MSKFIEKKIIKTSDRGVTFSFANSSEEHNVKTKFGIGERYVIDIQNNKMIILPSDEGLKVSKKKTKNDVKPLFDIRNTKALQAFKGSEFLEVTIFNDKILVEGFILTDNVNIETDSSSSIGTLLNVEKVASGYFDRKELDYDFDDLPSELASISYPMKVVSLFSGAGIFDSGWVDNFDVVFAIDSNKAATETYKENLGNHVVCGDICTFPKEEVPEAKIIIGGPSCRPFSIERSDFGTEKGKIENHPDSKLLFEYVKWITSEYASYDVFVIENVPGIISCNDGMYMKLIEEHLPEYEISSGIVNDLEQGGYQNRNRAIIIGSKIGKIDIPRAIVKPLDFKTFGDALKLVDDSWPNQTDVTIPREDTLNRMRHVPQGGNWTSIPKELRTRARHSNSYKRLSLNEPCITLVNYRKPNIIHPFLDRILTVSEAAAASGLDKTFKFLGTLNDKQQQVGNCVPVAMGRSVAKQVLDGIMNHLSRQLRKQLAFNI